MHELSITRQLIEMITKECESKIKKVKAITAELGQLTSYKKEPVLFYFDALKKDSPLVRNAKLLINETEGKDFIIKKITGN